MKKIYCLAIFIIFLSGCKNEKKARAWENLQSEVSRFLSKEFIKNVSDPKAHKKAAFYTNLLKKETSCGAAETKCLMIFYREQALRGIAYLHRISLFTKGRDKKILDQIIEMYVADRDKLLCQTEHKLIVGIVPPIKKLCEK